MSDDFLPTTIVLAKVKGYPAWPAMVLDEELLPSNIKSKKPKKQQKISIPVRFFSDDTYIWISPNDIKPLLKQDIEVHFSISSTKRRKDNLLERAFEIALDPPEMELFIKYGSKASPPSEDELELEQIGDEEIEIDDEDVIISKPKRKRIKLSPTTSKKESASEARAKAKEAKRLKELEIWQGYDSDWGIEEFNKFNKDIGDYIFDNESEQIKIFNKINENIKNLPNLIDKFTKIEEKILDLLIKNINKTKEDGKEEENDNDEFQLSSKEKDLILTQLDLLNDLIEIDQLPRFIINKSKLLRILILNQRKIINKDDDIEIRDKIDQFLSKLDINIRQNTIEEMTEKKEETQEEELPKIEEQEQEEDVVEVVNNNNQETIKENGTKSHNDEINNIVKEQSITNENKPTNDEDEILTTEVKQEVEQIK